MEVFVAKFDYEKEREDLLSFKVGEKFRIASKTDKKWWAAYSVESGDYGYVPSSYMQVRHTRHLFQLNLTHIRNTYVT